MRSQVSFCSSEGNTSRVLSPWELRHIPLSLLGFFPPLFFWLTKESARNRGHTEVRLKPLIAVAESCWITLSMVLNFKPPPDGICECRTHAFYATGHLFETFTSLGQARVFILHCSFLPYSWDMEMCSAVAGENKELNYAYVTDPGPWTSSSCRSVCFILFIETVNLRCLPQDCLKKINSGWTPSSPERSVGNILTSKFISFVHIGWFLYMYIFIYMHIY